MIQIIAKSKEIYRVLPPIRLCFSQFLFEKDLNSTRELPETHLEAPSFPPPWRAGCRARPAPPARSQRRRAHPQRRRELPCAVARSPAPPARPVAGRARRPGRRLLLARLGWKAKGWERERERERERESGSEGKMNFGGFCFSANEREEEEVNIWGK